MNEIVLKKKCPRCQQKVSTRVSFKKWMKFVPHSISCVCNICSTSTSTIVWNLPFRNKLVKWDLNFYDNLLEAVGVSLVCWAIIFSLVIIIL